MPARESLSVDDSALVKALEDLALHHDTSAYVLSVLRNGRTRLGLSEDEVPFTDTIDELAGTTVGPQWLVVLRHLVRTRELALYKAVKSFLYYDRFNDIAFHDLGEDPEVATVVSDRSFVDLLGLPNYAVEVVNLHTGGTVWLISVI